MIGLYDPDDKIEDDTFYFFILGHDKWADELVEEAREHQSKNDDNSDHSKQCDSEEGMECDE